MPEELIPIPNETEIPRGGTTIASSTDTDTTLPSSTTTETNIFLEEKSSPTTRQLSVTTEEDNNNHISKYIRIFITTSIITVIDIILIWLIYSYNIYISQASKITPDTDKVSYVEKYKGYLGEITSILGIDHTVEYNGLPFTTHNNQETFTTIVTTNDLSYIQKRDILKEKLRGFTTSVTNEAEEIETIKKNITRYGFLPLEIRNILQNEEVISAIQRSLNSLEIIKFSTALKVFSYMDSVVGIIGDSLKMDKDTVFSALEYFANRGENDVSSYVYMCYLNPFETSTDCTTLGDFDLYYQSILKDANFDRTLFKNVMKYLDIMLEQSDIPSFSIIFNGFNAGSKTINFNIEVNTTKQDELRLIAKGIKNPHIFIFTNLINLLKQSVFIIGGDIDTKTITIATRTIEMGNTAYTVNTSSKRFELPIQKSTEREIFDYIDIESLLDNIATELEDEEEHREENAEEALISFEEEIAQPTEEPVEEPSEEQLTEEPAAEPTQEQSAEEPTEEPAAQSTEDEVAEDIQSTEEPQEFSV